MGREALERGTQHDGMRVLVIEDEEALAAAIARGLRREGMAVDVALDGRSGLDKALVNDYDVIVLDRNLPGLHGDDVCRRFGRARRRPASSCSRRPTACATRSPASTSAPTTTWASRSPSTSSSPACAPSRAAPGRRGRPSCAAATSSSTPPRARRRARRRRARPHHKEFAVLEALLAAERRGRLGRGVAREGLGRERRSLHATWCASR